MSAAANLQVVGEALREQAGLITWWELSGSVIVEDLREAWEAAGFDPAVLPPAPGIDVVTWRAAQELVRPKERRLLRPLSKRGSWEIVQERVVFDDDMNDALEYEAVLRLDIERDGELFRVRLTPEDSLEAEHVRARLGFYGDVLAPSDVSGWLLGILSSQMFEAVSLRQRGGFYFVPQDRTELWRRIVAVVQSVSNHRIYEIPAVRTDDVVEAVLKSVRAEAEQRMSEMETYLAGETSNRGINSTERKADDLRHKLAHYVDVLGVALPDLVERAEQLSGQIQAARLSRVAVEAK